MHHRILAVDDLPTFRSTLLLLVFLLAAVPFSCSASPVHAVFGETIPFGGTAPGSDVIYLFLTGPNLPYGGISLVGGTPVVTGAPGSFTRAEVFTDGTWAYTWRTGDLGRILDSGTYVVYAVLEPRAFPDLDDASYTTQAIVVGAPVETVTVAATVSTGTVAVNSTPAGSVVTLDGQRAGITPLLIPDVTPGSHTLSISREGYAEFRADIVITAGERKEVSAVLRPITPIPTTSATVPSSTPPGRLAPTLITPLSAIALAILGLHRRGRPRG